MFLNLGDSVFEGPADATGAPLDGHNEVGARDGRDEWRSGWKVEAFLANGRHFRHYVVVNLVPEIAEQRAVLKTIKYDPARCNDSDYVATLRARLVRECETLTHFSPRLPDAIDLFEMENQQDPFSGFGASQLRLREPVLVQTLVHGIPLSTLMHERGAPPAATDALLLCLCKICTFLEELHAGGRGWLFSGLTPEHIIVDPDQELEPRFVGCSNFRMLKKGVAVGEPTSAVQVSRPEAGYAAPEALSGGACDAREDVYALGALLFHLFTGIDPRGLADDLLGAKRSEVLTPTEASDFAHRLRIAIERFCRRDLKGLGIHRARVRKTLLKALAPAPAERFAGPTEVRAELLASLRRSMPVVWAS